MRFGNSFEVPLPPQEAWPVLLDIERIAPCVPGAELTGKIGDNAYNGKVSVRLGPVSLSFAGTVTLEDIDPVGHTVSVKAKGADSRGRGSANAQAAIQLLPTDAGSRVEIDTDLVLTGSIAQYGRGVGLIKDVADQLVSEFAARLREDIMASAAGAAGPDAAAEAEQDRKSERPRSELSGFKLLFAVLKRRLGNIFGSA